MNREQIEQLHNQGLMPDWAYYQQVKKPWYISLAEQDQSLLERNKRYSNEDTQIERFLDDQLKEIVSKKIDEIFSNFIK